MACSLTGLAGKVVESVERKQDEKSKQEKVGLTFLEAQNPHGVQCVNEGQTKAKPLAEGLGDGLQLIMAPGKFFVAFPGMMESLDHSHLTLVKRH